MVRNKSAVKSMSPTCLLGEETLLMALSVAGSSCPIAPRLPDAPWRDRPSSAPALAAPPRRHWRQAPASISVAGLLTILARTRSRREGDNAGNCLLGIFYGRLGRSGWHGVCLLLLGIEPDYLHLSGRNPVALLLHDALSLLRIKPIAKICLELLHTLV